MNIPQLLASMDDMSMTARPTPAPPAAASDPISLCTTLEAAGACDTGSGAEDVLEAAVPNASSNDVNVSLPANGNGGRQQELESALKQRALLAEQAYLQGLLEKV